VSPKSAIGDGFGGAESLVEDGEEVNQSVDAGVLFAPVTMVDDEIAINYSHFPLWL
jgi:hypothetical protein